MPKPVYAHGFRGMNNLGGMPAKLLDDERRITPHIVLNAEVTDGGALIQRQGHVKKISLNGAHSLWAESVMLVVAAGNLYRVEGTTPTAICAVAGPKARMTYVEIDNLVYISNPYWTGVLELLTGTVRSWGVSLPPAPDIDLVTGDMPPGTYNLCYTQAANSRISGNGPLVQVSWEGGAQGIQLNNLPAGGQAWITHPNGQNLFLATVAGGIVTGQAPQAIPLPTFTVAPPPGMNHFCHAFGRIWGCTGKKVIYSDPFQYDWFRTANYKPFLEDLVLLAPVNGGIFVNSLDSTWFLDGTVPEEMTVKRVGDGAVPGTLTIAKMPGSVVGGGYEISRRMSGMSSPVWMSKNGVCVGTQTGHLVHLTESRLRLTPRQEGAAVYRVKEGRPQIITSLYGPPLAEEDKEIQAVIADGKLFD